MSRNLRSWRRRIRGLGELLEPHRFSRGRKWGSIEFSPRFSDRRRAVVERWLHAAPEKFFSRLPAIRVATARLSETFEDDCVHALSFIPQGYLLLGEDLFASPAELGRILFHELCHFLWPRLRRGRGVYEAAILREAGAGIGGELGFSAAAARLGLPAHITNPERLAPTEFRRWRHYLCESFCDTGAYVLPRRSGYGRSRHSEWTLPRQARPAREAAWLEAAGLGSREIAKLGHSGRTRRG